MNTYSQTLYKVKKTKSGIMKLAKVKTGEPRSRPLGSEVIFYQLSLRTKIVLRTQLLSVSVAFY